MLIRRFRLSPAVKCAFFQTLLFFLKKLFKFLHFGQQRDAKGFAVYEGDHLSLLNCYNAYIAAKNPQSWCQRRGVRSLN